MFTGIIEQLGTVTRAEDVDFGRVLEVDAGAWGHRPAAGESIAVAGVCLTVAGAPQVGPDGRVRLRFDVIRQTLDCTVLGDLAAGDDVNLEASVTPASLLGGHLVQGHVDGVGTVVRVESGAEEWRVTIAPPADLERYIVKRGSIAVDGVSLTVAELSGDGFEIALIPTTLELTTLSRLREGSRVNLETDYIAKIVVSWLERAERPT